MKNILVPTDFSDHSIIAVNFAIELARKFESNITLLNTYEGLQKTGSFKSIDPILEKEAVREMGLLKKKLALEDGNPKISEKIVKGDAVSMIVSLSSKDQYDLIVMGTKGATGLKKIFMGSVASGVISKTKTPALIIPEDSEYRPFELIVLGLSGLPLSSSAVVMPLKKIAKAFQSKLTVLHLADQTEESFSEVLESLDELNPTTVFKFGKGDINRRISEYVLESDADLLCLIRRKKGLFDRLFDESVTLKQTFNSNSPLLILQN